MCIILLLCISHCCLWYFYNNYCSNVHPKQLFVHQSWVCFLHWSSHTGARQDHQDQTGSKKAATIIETRGENAGYNIARNSINLIFQCRGTFNVYVHDPHPSLPLSGFHLATKIWGGSMINEWAYSARKVPWDVFLIPPDCFGSKTNASGLIWWLIVVLYIACL